MNTVSSVGALLPRFKSDISLLMSLLRNKFCGITVSIVLVLPCQIMGFCSEIGMGVRVLPYQIKNYDNVQ